MWSILKINNSFDELIGREKQTFIIGNHKRLSYHYNMIMIYARKIEHGHLIFRENTHKVLLNKIILATKYYMK